MVPATVVNAFTLVVHHEAQANQSPLPNERYITRWLYLWSYAWAVRVRNLGKFGTSDGDRNSLLMNRYVSVSPRQRVEIAAYPDPTNRLNLNRTP